MKRRSFICAATAGLPILAGAQASTYPNKPIRVVVAWPAGSLIDVITRIITLNMVTAMGNKQNFKVPDSFTPILNVAWSPMVLVSTPSLGLKTPQDLLALSKSRNGNVFYATS
eukprot:gene30560-52717_t